MALEMETTTTLFKKIVAFIDLYHFIHEKDMAPSHLQRNTFSNHITENRITKSLKKTVKLDKYNVPGDPMMCIEHVDIMFDFHHEMSVMK